MKMKTRKGFTLTELLIVMAVIVVLAAVAIPTFGRQLETSRETADMEIIRNAYSEVFTYVTQDAADGKLDGKIGGTQAEGGIELKAAGISIQSEASGAIPYKIVIAEALEGAKFSQSANANDWSYVKPLLMGLTVPTIDNTKKSLTFSFKFSVDTGSRGELQLVGQGSSGSDLFTSAAA